MPKGVRLGGRQKGTPNKATADIKALARVHAPAVIDELARLALHAEGEAARVAAIKELLDRGFGKARQPLVGGDDEDNPIRTVSRIELVGVPSDHSTA